MYSKDNFYHQKEQIMNVFELFNKKRYNWEELKKYTLKMF